MYFTRENIDSLDNIITKINKTDDEIEKKKFLDEHVEDSTMFLDTLKKINKSKIPKEYFGRKEKKKEDLFTGLYKEEEIFEIFSQKDNNTIMKEYSLTELKRMYVSVYNRKPASKYTKERIINILRDRMHTMNRASAFAKLAEERDIRKVNNL